MRTPEIGLRTQPALGHSISIRRLLAAGSVVLALFLAPKVSVGDDWTEFRGPTGQGHSTATGLPIHWDSTSSNIRWKSEIPGRGWSSPIVLHSRAYLTTAVPESDAPDAKQSLRAVCLDTKTGDIVWNVEVFPLLDGQRAQLHKKNSFASSTPVTDGKTLFVHFGTQGTARLSLEGEILWKTRELEFEPRHGCGNSPVLIDDLIVVNCDGADIQFVTALEQATGKVRWKRSRPPVDEIKKFSFATPLVINVAGRKQIVSPGAHGVVSYDPVDGTEIWQVKYHGYSLSPRPVYGHGLVFVCTGFDKASLLAIRPTGHGDVTETEVAWRTDRGVPNTSSPLLIGEELYFVSDQGVASCVDARSGKLHWTKRIGGNHSASPLYADGKIYFQSESGETTIIRPGRQSEELARNNINATTYASLAIEGRGLLLRTAEALYRIESE